MARWDQEYGRGESRKVVTLVLAAFARYTYLVEHSTLIGSWVLSGDSTTVRQGDEEGEGKRKMEGNLLVLHAWYVRYLTSCEPAKPSWAPKPGRGAVGKGDGIPLDVGAKGMTCLGGSSRYVVAGTAGGS